MPATHDYWPLVLENLKTRVSQSNFKAWFSRLKFVGTGNQGRKITLAVPSVFNKNYIESRFKTELKEALAKYYPQVIHIDYKVEPTQEEVKQEQDSLTLEEAAVPTAIVKSEPQQDKTEPEKVSSYLPKKNISNLNPKYTFENFVVTRNNELAANVSQAIVNQPGTLYNPVFIYSRVGLGKTHLLQAIGHKIVEKNPGFNVKYLPAETFINQWILALQKRETEQFRHYYRSIDLLLIDDIQFFAMKESTQEVFFHLFNELHEQNKQIVLTSDKPPKDLMGIEERLTSRFDWGMVVDISKPELEDRVTILKDKAMRMQLSLTSDQLVRIAQVIDSNVRELEGVLNQIQARVKLIPDREFADADLDKVLGPAIQVSQQINIVNSADIKNATPDSILQAVCRIFTLQKQDILGDSREKNIALARQLTFWFYKHELDLSYPTIGRLFGGRDHTTVMHGCNKIDTLKLNDKRIQDKIQLTRQMLSGK